jgi:hypothetical protein
VHRDDEQRLIAGVPEAVRRLLRHHEHLVGVQIDDVVAGRPAAVAFEEENVSEYGCTWRSTPLPGGVRTTKTEMPTPARGRPSKSAAVGLNLMSSSSKTSIVRER